MNTKSFRRLYLFTGKGGVGKSIVSMAMADYLQSIGKTVNLYFLKNSSIGDTAPNEPEISSFKKLNIHFKGLELEGCAEEYIAKKLNSKLVAGWIVKTSFFKALINMLPGFSYLIFMGKILEDLHNNPELIAVLDAPASGHTITMLESTYNFREIFNTGIIFEDTQKMFNLLQDPNFIDINIVTIPTSMALNEAMDLKTEITPYVASECHIICNNVLELNPDIIEIQNAPEFLKTKLKLEQDAMNEVRSNISFQLPFVSSNDASQIAITLGKSLGQYS